MKKLLSLSDNQVFKNLLNHLKNNDEFEVATDINDTILIIGDWNKYNKLEEFISAFENSNNIRTGFDDEYFSCTSCYKKIAIYNDDYIRTDCDILCPDCAIENFDDILQELMNETDKAIPRFIPIDLLEKAGFKHHSDYQIGLHDYMNDSLESIIQSFETDNNLGQINDKYDYVFKVTGGNFFMTDYSLHIKEGDD